MNPVQRALNIRQSGGRKSSDERRIGLYPKSNTVNHAVIFDCRSREHVDIGMHSGLDPVELGLAEVRDGPPCARVDQGEDLLAGVGVSALGDIQIGYPCIERRVHLAIVEVVLGGADGRGSSLTLSSKRLDGKHAVLRLAELRMTLLDHR